MRTPSGSHIVFSHVIGEFPIHPYRTRGELRFAKHRTICEVFADEAESILVARGVATCSPRDQFSREIGRQLALHRAVTVLPHGSKIGAELLGAYQSRRGARAWVIDRNGRIRGGAR